MRLAICIFFVALSIGLVGVGLSDMFFAKTTVQFVLGSIIAAWNVWNVQMWHKHLKAELKKCS